MCAMGKYKDVIANDECSGCPGGSNSSFGSDSVFDCVACPIGTYGTEQGCVDCPSNTTSPPASDRITNCTCLAGYAATVPGAACAPCSVGKYKLAGVGVCQNCPQHTVSVAAAANVSECLCINGFHGPGGGPCLKCPEGSYKDKAGGPCLMCSLGKYQNRSGQTSEADCTACGVGKYSITVGSRSEGSCIKCPAYSNAPQASIHQSNCTCNMGYTGADGSACSACPRGTYKAVRGSTGCVQCAEGKYGRIGGQETQSDCLDCLPFTYSSRGSGSITNCTCNSGYTGQGGGIPCLACLAGSYKDVNGSASCSLCAHGKYSTEKGEMSEATCSACPAHTFSGGGSSTVANCSCNVGYTGPDGGSCEACVAGTYKDVNGSAPCSLCAAGKYSTELGEIESGTCVHCPANSMSIAGSPALANCTCLVGHAGPDGGPCEPCAAGSYKDVNGSQACALCPQGTYSQEVAQESDTTCSACPVHSYSAEGSGVETNCSCNLGYSGPDGQDCFACAPGTFKSIRGSSECSPCGAGKYSAGKGEVAESVCSVCSTHTTSLQGSGAMSNCTCVQGYTHQDGQCVGCEPGKFKGTIGNAACDDCLENQFSAAGAINCTECPAKSIAPALSTAITDCKCSPGHFGPAGGVCQDCGPGKYTDTANNAACDDCAAGTYQSNAEATDCKACPDSNAISAEASEAKESCLCSAGYTGPNGGLCQACAAGTRKTAIGPAACVKCLVGTYVDTEGATACLNCPRNSSTAAEASTALTDCQCNAGYTGPDGGTCLACDAGKVKESQGSALCDDCLENQFSAAGAINCTECPAKSIAPALSTAITDCECSPGHFGPAGGVCQDCSPGKYTDTANNAACDDCTAGTYQSNAEATDCTTCSSGMGLTWPRQDLPRPWQGLGGPCRGPTTPSLANLVSRGLCMPRFPAKLLPRHQEITQQLSRAHRANHAATNAAKVLHDASACFLVIAMTRNLT